MIYPENFELKTDFVKVRQKIKEFCLGNIGKGLVDDMLFISNYKTVIARLNETSELKTILDGDEEFPIAHYFDLRKTFAKIRVDGTYFDTDELVGLRNSLQIVKAIVRFFSQQHNADKYISLKAIADNVTLYPYVFDGIDRILNKQGKIKDNASPELAKIRAELAEKQGSVSKLLRSIIIAAQKEGWVDTDASLVVRDGRTVIPIQASFKRKIQGIVYDESATGKTCYIEPAPVVELNNLISELEADERREIIKILKEFTDNVRPYADDLEDSIIFLGIIDFIQAKAKFAKTINALLPNVINQPVIDWQDALHPVLYMAFKPDGRTVVPLTLKLTQEQRILVISGPNAGGKSVCLKTVGLIQYMLQCGLLIPVNNKSTAGVFKNIFIDIGDEQSIENDLSTYSSHLLNMKHFVKNADNNTLVLIDEFGTGTEPMLGGAIAEAVLNKINNNKVFGVITTHYTNLKHFAGSQSGIINGAMLYDTDKLEPLFVLETGKPGSSFAFEIAYKTGLPQDVIDDAKSKVGEEHLLFDKNLKEIIRDKRYWERKRLNIRKIERRLEEMMEKEKAELEKALNIRKEIKQEAQAEAKKILADTNKIIENTVRVIKESQADKEKTKIVRQELEVFKDTVNKDEAENDDKILRKMQKLRERETKSKKSKTDMQPEIDKPAKKPAIEVGSPVRIIGQTSIGEVMELNDKNAVVAFGNLLTSVAINRLEQPGASEVKQAEKKSGTAAFKQSYELSVRRMNFKTGIDVRGKRAEDALRIIRDYIDEAAMLGIPEVKILHGKGNGILRQLLREYLNTVDVVEKATDEHIDFGGAGITVVTLF